MAAGTLTATGNPSIWNLTGYTFALVDACEAEAKVTTFTIGRFSFFAAASSMQVEPAPVSIKPHPAIGAGTGLPCLTNSEATGSANVTAICTTGPRCLSATLGGIGTLLPSGSFPSPKSWLCRIGME